MIRIPSLEDRVLELIRRFLAEELPFDEFESSFYSLYPDAERYPVVSDACDSLFSEVLEKLSWASEKVSPDARSEGWATANEFRSWLRDRLQTTRPRSSFWVEEENVKIEDRDDLVAVLKCVADGQIIEDPEFETIFGRTRSEFREMADRFEKGTFFPDDLRMALSHLSWILMYPGASKSITSRIEVTRSQLESLHATLRETHGQPPEDKGC